MSTFWDCIPIDERGRAFVDLAQYQWDKHGLKLELPPEPKQEPVINAPDYQELEEMEIGRELSQPPHSPERVE